MPVTPSSNMSSEIIFTSSEAGAMSEKMRTMAYSEYLGKLKMLCIQMNDTMFPEDATAATTTMDKEDADAAESDGGDNDPIYIYKQRKPCFLDYALYHELLTAMLVANVGKRSFLFPDDKRTRKKIKRLSSWYMRMASKPINKKLCDQFSADLAKNKF